MLLALNSRSNISSKILGRINLLFDGVFVALTEAGDAKIRQDCKLIGYIVVEYGFLNPVL